MWAFWLAAVLSAGCSQNPAPQPPVATNPAAAVPAAPVPPAPDVPKPADDDGPVYFLDHAQVGLPRAKLMIGTRDLAAEICSSLPQVATGLMHRRGIGPAEGMLFVFGGPQRRSFYMRNVAFPIAAAYIDTEGVIQEIVQLKAMDRTPVPSKSDRIQFVLETAPDWFERNGVGVGTQIVTDRGSLPEKLGPLARLP